MGTVYEAYQASMHRKVALKVLDRPLLPSDDTVARFEREAWIGGRLNHPNIVSVFAQGADGSIHWIAMELVEGPSLHHQIEEFKAQRLSGDGHASGTRGERLRTVVSLFVGVADALAHVHRQGIVHRDVKPLNLLLADGGTRLLLSDFGIAREEEVSRITRRGDFLGTVRYMSPEQLLAHRARVDGRTDIWSLGVSLYEAVTLELPYSAPTEEAYVSAVGTKEPLAARARNRAVPRDLETILMKCLQRDPDRRYQTAEALRDDLVRFLEHRPVAARRPGPLQKSLRFLRRHRTPAIAAATAFGVAVVAIGFAMRQIGVRSDMETIRWTLRQVLAKKVEANSLQPDWARLERKLHEVVRRDPTGDVAKLALRASVVVAVKMNSFGLTDNPPALSFDAQRLLDPGVDSRLLADIEGSWDEGPWRPVARCQGPGRFGGVGTGSVGPGFLFGPAATSAGPHRLALRATLSFLPSEQTVGGAAPPVTRIAGELNPPEASLNCNPAAPKEELPPAWAAAMRAPILRESRTLETLSGNLFDKYPSDFPTRISESDLTGPLEDWFRVDRIRVACVRVPAGHGSRIAFVGPGGEEFSALLPPGAGEGARRIAGLTMTGLFRRETPLPVAAEAAVRPDGSMRPLLQLPFAFGDQYLSVSSADTYWDGEEQIRAILTGGNRGALNIPDEAPPDGKMRGHLELKSSRDVAIATRELDRYLGRDVSMPVDIEIVTVDARWADEPVSK